MRDGVCQEKVCVMRGWIMRRDVIGTCIDGLCDDIVFMNGSSIEIGTNVNEGG